MNVEFRPTLLVGLGGTGTTILTWLKAMLLDNVGESVFNTIRLVALDIDSTLPEVRRRDGQVIRLNAHTEFIHLGNVPTTEMMRNLHRHPEVAAWLPSTIPNPVITRGANMIRPLGRLSLYYHFPSVVRSLGIELRKIRRLLDMYRSVGQTGTRVVNREAEVFLITSVCGGTGAGTFIDMAYLLRHLCSEELFLNTEETFVTGVLVLPSAFPTVEAKNRLAANTKACLDDLDHLTTTGFEEAYPDGYRLSFPLTPPFNACYLVEAVNRNNYVLNGMEEVGPMVATSVYLHIASHIGPIERSRQVNIDNTMRFYEGRPTIYSGLGCARLIFPVEQIANYCARRFCRVFVERKMLQQTPSAEAIEQQLLSFLRQNGIAAETLLAEMVKARKQQPRVSVGINQQALASVGVDHIVDRVKRLIQTNERKLEEQFNKQMLPNQEELVAKLIAALTARLDELINDPLHGLNTGAAFVERLEHELLTMSESINEARDQVVLNLANDTQRSKDVFRMLNDAVSSRLPFWRNRQATRASDEYLRTEEQRLRNQLTLHQYDLTLRLLAALREAASELRRTYSELRGRLANLVHLLSTQQNGEFDLEREVESLSWPVSRQQDVDKLYERFLPGDAQWLDLARQHCGPVAEWRRWGQQELEQRLLHFARQPFQGITTISIEQFINDSGSTEVVGEWIDRIRHRSVPFWNWVEGRAGDLRTAYVHVLGVPNHEDSIFSNHPEVGEEMVSIYDPHAVVMLSTEHGMSSSVLGSYGQYERAYSQVRNQVPFLRLFDPTVRKKPAKEFAPSLEIFAKGQVLGYIVEKAGGDLYFQQPDRPDAEERRLSRDLEHAVERLGGAPELITIIESAAARYRAENGNAGVREKVKAYLQQDGRTDLSEVRKQLADAAQKWADLS